MAGITFFVCTLEEYHLERLDFPPINGVNEGTLVASAVLIFTGFKDENFWLQTTNLFGFYLKYNQVLVYAFFLASMVFAFLR